MGHAGSVLSNVHPFSRHLTFLHTFTFSNTYDSLPKFAYTMKGCVSPLSPPKSPSFEIQKPSVCRT